MNQKLVTKFGGFDQPVDIGKIQMWVNALSKHVQPKGDQINIAGTLAIAKQSAFDTIGTCHQAKFGCSDRTAAVIMRVKRQNHRISIGEMTAHPFNLIRIDIWRRHLNRCWQIDNGWIFRA